MWPATFRLGPEIVFTTDYDGPYREYLWVHCIVCPILYAKFPERIATLFAKEEPALAVSSPAVQPFLGLRNSSACCMPWNVRGSFPVNRGHNIFSFVFSAFSVNEPILRIFLCQRVRIRQWKSQEPVFQGSRTGIGWKKGRGHRFGQRPSPPPSFRSPLLRWSEEAVPQNTPPEPTPKNRSSTKNQR